MPKTIRALREARGETTRQLAQVLGVSLLEAHRLERGILQPTAAQLRRLATHFGVRAIDLDLAPRAPSPRSPARPAAPVPPEAEASRRGPE